MLAENCRFGELLSQRRPCCSLAYQQGIELVSDSASPLRFEGRAGFRRAEAVAVITLRQIACKVVKRRARIWNRPFAFATSRVLIHTSPRIDHARRLTLVGSG